MKNKLNLGDDVPDFILKDQDSVEHKLSDYKGKKVLIYFYPKDNTPGCTQEACNFRDSIGFYNDNNFIILGISKDNEKSHKKFSEKYNLNFPILSDVDGKVCEAYGVWKLKKFMGREYMGISRESFLIDENGKLLKHFEKVNTKTHNDEIKDSFR